MKVRELIEQLESFDGDAEVRMMTQSNYPLEYSVAGTWEPSPEPDACGECGLTRAAAVHTVPEDEESPEWLEGHEFESYNEWMPYGGVKAIHIVEGTQLGYGTKDAWQELGDRY